MAKKLRVQQVRPTALDRFVRTEREHAEAYRAEAEAGGLHNLKLYYQGKLDILARLEKKFLPRW